MKKTDVMGWVILICMLLSNYYIYKNLNGLRVDIKENAIPKLTITDVNQFEIICEQFKKQWGFKNYFVYVLQPNSNFKTHKELVTTTIPNVPIRLPIFKYNDLMVEVDNYYIGENDVFPKITDDEFNLNSKFVMIPIFRYNVVVAELIILVDDFDTIYSAKVEEAQILEHLIN